jgi:hypothetical protein
MKHVNYTHTQTSSHFQKNKALGEELGAGMETTVIK